MSLNPAKFPKPGVCAWCASPHTRLLIGLRKGYYEFQIKCLTCDASSARIEIPSSKLAYIQQFPREAVEPIMYGWNRAIKKSKRRTFDEAIIEFERQCGIFRPEDSASYGVITDQRAEPPPLKREEVDDAIYSVSVGGAVTTDSDFTFGVTQYGYRPGVTGTT